jgi:HNH endonuclease
MARPNYRRIYEKHYGPIPKEPDGRTYEVHHIDGNHSNNKPENLKAITLKDHYDIHYSQGDWAACYYMSIQRMNKTPEELSDLSKLIQLERVKNGTHHFLDSKRHSEWAYWQVENGTHPFLGGEIQRELAIKKVNDGTHPFLGKNNNLKQFAEGKHSTQIKKTCEHCGIIVSTTNYSRWHGNKCPKINK